jgi:hypothetical protein
MDSNYENISFKINNLLRKYQHGMVMDEIQLAVTSQWLKISEFSQRPLALQIKLLSALLQFVILSKDRIEGPNYLGRYFGKLLNSISMTNSLIWHQSRAIGSSLVQIMLEIFRTRKFSHSTLSLSYEGLVLLLAFLSHCSIDFSEDIEIPSLDHLKSLFLFFCSSYSSLCDLQSPNAPNSSQHLFAPTDLILILQSIRLFDTSSSSSPLPSPADSPHASSSSSSSQQPMLSFLGLLTSPSLLENVPWEPSGTPQGVLSVTCYDTSPKSSLFEKVGVTKSGDQFVSPSTTSLNHEPSVWNHAPSSSMQVSPFSPTHSSKGVLESRGSGTSSTLSSPPLSAVCSGIIISISLWGASMTMLHGQASCGIVWQSGWSMALPLRTRHPMPVASAARLGSGLWRPRSSGSVLLARS